jgi:hypothetical protein
MILIAWRYMKGYIVYMFEIPRDDKKLGAWCMVHGWCSFITVIARRLRMGRFEALLKY